MKPFSDGECGEVHVNRAGRPGLDAGLRKESNRSLLALVSVISSSERLAMLIDEQDRSELFKREERHFKGDIDRGNSVEKRLVHKNTRR